MRYVFRNVSVDAGNISVFDKALAEKLEPSGLRQIQVDEPGEYEVKLIIFDTHCSCGRQIRAKKQMKLTTTTFYVGDACYAFNDDWAHVERKPGFLSVNTGGDGGFDVTVVITKTP